jgi:hypothetical protein
MFLRFISNPLLQIHAFDGFGAPNSIFLWDFVQTGEEPCPIDPWIVVPDKSKYVDQQTLKMQENPEVIILILVNWMVVLS